MILVIYHWTLIAKINKLLIKSWGMTLINTNDLPCSPWFVIGAHLA
jgi:hypothetical protein